MNINELSADFVNIIKSEDIKNDLIEIAKVEPIISSLINLARLAKDTVNIPNMLFYSKLEKFLFGVCDIEFEKRINFMSKYINEKEDLFVEKIIFIIDKIDDKNKSLIIANLFRSLFYENIDLGLFFRLCDIVNDCMLEDLSYLLKNKDTDIHTLNLNIDSLCKVGLIQRTLMGTTNKYEISFLGYKLLENGLAYGDLPSILKSQEAYFSKEILQLKETEVKTIATFM